MRAWGIAAAAALVWVLAGLPVIPLPLAETVGWRRFFWVEFGLESTVAILPAVVVATRAQRWNALPALWAYATIAVAIIGAAAGTGLMWTSHDASLQDSYYAVAHLRFVSRMSALMSLFTMFYAWFARANRALAGAQLALMFFGTVGNFLGPLVFLRFAMPRRYSDYPEAWTSANTISAVAAAMTGAGLLVFLAVLAEAFIRRKPRMVL
jgi:heme/copper-type cytochrome/quinol oxidase subunit 1